MASSSPFRTPAALVVLLLAACQPADQSGSVQAWVYALDHASNTYSLTTLPVEHLDSLRELRGRDFSFRASSSLNVGLSGGSLEGSVDRGSSVAFDYTTDDAGAVVAADTMSLYMISLYRILDWTASVYRAHGYAPDVPLDVYFNPRFDVVFIGDLRSEFTDNAGFMPLARGFMVFPSFLMKDGLPLDLNEGVFAHEFGHSVVQQVLFQRATKTPHDGETAWALASRHLDAFNEAFADLSGFIVSADPNFIEPSIAGYDSRNLAVPWIYDDATLAELSNLDNTSYDSHHHGSYLARAIYELWPKSASGLISEEDRGRMLDLLLASLSDLAYTPDFTFVDFANVLVRKLPTETQPRACSVLLKDLAPLAARLTACGGK